MGLNSSYSASFPDNRLVSMPLRWASLRFHAHWGSIHKTCRNILFRGVVPLEVYMRQVKLGENDQINLAAHPYLFSLKDRNIRQKNKE